MRKIFLFATLALASALCARESLDKVYEGLMNDPDLFAGEGLVSRSSYGGDAEKAKASARERARASLVESIRVHVVSQVKDTQKSGRQGDLQEVEAKSVSSSDLELENIQYRALDDFPKDGQLTVVATLSKLDYDRQMAGLRKNRFRPYWGLMVYYILYEKYVNLDKLLDDESRKGRSGLAFSSTMGSVSGSIDPPQGFGLQFRYKEWSLGIEKSSGRALIYPYDPATALYRWDYTSFDIFGAEAGWDFAPLASRFQPYIPLRLRYFGVSIGEFSGSAPQLSAGLGMRYWASESFFFNLAGQWNQGLGEVELTDSGKPFWRSPGRKAMVDFSGVQCDIGLTWTGF